ncbi:MAG TPA: nitroreductase/quinone reductase family protein [Anaerolineales bacterium]|nr:nitroreductase/quinone reductase family protein [Anaerolineales bacterium]
MKLEKEIEMSASPTIPPYINSAVTTILRSPLHGLFSQSFLLLTFTGRKSGRTFTTPVGYSQSGDTLTLFTHARWWKNLLNAAPVTLHLRGREIQGVPEPVTGQEAILAGLLARLRRVPRDAGFYGVTIDNRGYPDLAETIRAVQSVVMIRIRLETSFVRQSSPQLGDAALEH